eukprot:89982-Hanusia_phi.AAC.1
MPRYGPAALQTDSKQYRTVVTVPLASPPPGPSPRHQILRYAPPRANRISPLRVTIMNPRAASPGAGPGGRPGPAASVVGRVRSPSGSSESPRVC